MVLDVKCLFRLRISTHSASQSAKYCITQIPPWVIYTIVSALLHFISLYIVAWWSNLVAWAHSARGSGRQRSVSMLMGGLGRGHNGITSFCPWQRMMSPYPFTQKKEKDHSNLVSSRGGWNHQWHHPLDTTLWFCWQSCLQICVGTEKNVSCVLIHTVLDYK